MSLGNEVSNGTRAVRFTIGVMEAIIALMLLVTILQLGGLIERADKILNYHEEDLMRLASTSRARNQMFRLMGDKMGIPREDVDDAIAEDWMANEDWSRARKKRVRP